MKQFLRRNRWALLILPLGLLGGFLYWKYVGCLSGQCALKSNPYAMMGYGSAFAVLIGSMIDERLGKRKNKDEKAA